MITKIGQKSEGIPFIISFKEVNIKVRGRFPKYYFSKISNFHSPGMRTSLSTFLSSLFPAVHFNYLSRY
jgi:hypothetical protein